MNYLNDLPEEQPRRTLGLQCLHHCQGIEPRCMTCPKDDMYISTSDKVFKVALILLGIVVGIGITLILFSI